MRRVSLFAILAAIAACGGGSSTPDAAADGRTDAPVADAPVDAVTAGPVSLTVWAPDRTPQLGVDVVFYDPAGAVVSHQVTGSTGKVSEDLLPGGAVTAVRNEGGGLIAYSWLAVEPGDDLVLGTPGPAPADVGPISVTLPGAAATATQYQVRLGCRTLTTTDPASPVTGELTADCLGSDTKIDVVAAALAGDGSVVGYAFSQGVTANQGGTTDVTLGAWQTQTDPLTFTLTNTPAAAGAAGVEVHLRIDGLDFGGAVARTQVSGTTVTLDAPYPHGLAVDRLQYLLTVLLGPIQTPTGFLQVIAGEPDAPSTVDLDLSQGLLPALGDVSDAEASDQLELTWTAAGSLAGTDGGFALAYWSEGQTGHAWVALLPPGATSPLRLPRLPDELAAWRPTATSVLSTPGIIFADADFLDGYRALRAGPGINLLGGGQAFDVIPATGGTWRVTIGGQIGP